MSQDNAFQSKLGNAPTMYPLPPITNQPQAVLVQSPPPQFGPHSQRVTCPSCHNTDMSKIKHETTMKTHMIAGLLCVTTCCCCIPYMVNTCKSTDHVCKSCGAYLGKYEK